jgi:hypothetical protein
MDYLHSLEELGGDDLLRSSLPTAKFLSPSGALVKKSFCAAEIFLRAITLTAK